MIYFYCKDFPDNFLLKRVFLCLCFRVSFFVYVGFGFVSILCDRSEAELKYFSSFPARSLRKLKSIYNGLTYVLRIGFWCFRKIMNFMRKSIDLNEAHVHSIIYVHAVACKYARACLLTCAGDIGKSWRAQTGRLKNVVTGSLSLCKEQPSPGIDSVHCIRTHARWELHNYVSWVCL